MYRHTYICREKTHVHIYLVFLPLSTTMQNSFLYYLLYTMYYYFTARYCVSRCLDTLNDSYVYCLLYIVNQFYCELAQSEVEFFY